MLRCSLSPNCACIYSVPILSTYRSVYQSLVKDKPKRDIQVFLMEVTQALQMCGNVDHGEEVHMGISEQGVYGSHES